jgi:hypothetical protein
MAEHNHANRSEWVADNRVGKSFTVISTNGDLPTNPMSLRECMVCGGCSPVTNHGNTLMPGASHRLNSHLPPLAATISSPIRHNTQEKRFFLKSRSGCPLNRLRLD